MTDRQQSGQTSSLDDTIDAVLREVAGSGRSVHVRARVLNRLAGEGAPARSSLGLRWQSRWAVPAVGVAAVAIVAVVAAALLIGGPSPSNLGGKTAAPGETSAHRAAPALLGQPPDKAPSQAPTVSALADRAASVAVARAHAIGGLARRPAVASRAVQAGVTADAAAEGDTPAIGIEPLTMDPLATPAPVHMPAIEIAPIVVPDIQIQMIEMKPLDVGSAPRPPDPGKSQQR
jgi:hypothetical protein